MICKAKQISTIIRSNTNAIFCLIVCFRKRSNQHKRELQSVSVCDENRILFTTLHNEYKLTHRSSFVLALSTKTTFDRFISNIINLYLLNIANVVFLTFFINLILSFILITNSSLIVLNSKTLQNYISSITFLQFFIFVFSIDDIFTSNFVSVTKWNETRLEIIEFISIFIFLYFIPFIIQSHFPIDQLPNHLLVDIFANSEPKTICTKLASISRRWRRLAATKSLWHNVKFDINNDRERNDCFALFLFKVYTLRHNLFLLLIVFYRIITDRMPSLTKTKSLYFRKS